MRTRTATLAVARNPQNETLVHATLSLVASLPNPHAAQAACAFGTTVLSEQYCLLPVQGNITAPQATAVKADSK
jgi:hypothetical protein